MALVFEIKSEKELDIQEFMDFLGVDDLTAEDMEANDVEASYVLYHKKRSLTTYVIDQLEDNLYTVSFDPMSSYQDYKLLPYLLDSLSQWLNSTPYIIELEPDDTGQSTTQTAYQFFDEEWAQIQIGEAVAYAKCLMSLHLPYYIELPDEHFYYINESLLNSYGVDLHSSTPRIFGYIHYLYLNNKLPYSEEFPEIYDNLEGRELTIEVPQHVSIGTAKSWDTDGSITTDSFCAQDVALLVNIGQRYLSGAKVDGVVLNDLGTLFQEGIGMDKDMDIALQWYKAALECGDTRFAPSNIGDIYRKGWSSEGVQLEKAFKAYLHGEDPYAWYRVGQAYEEGWTSKPDMDLAMRWYKKAAKHRHHLALERLAQKP